MRRPSGCGQKDWQLWPSIEPEQQGRCRLNELIDAEDIQSRQEQRSSPLYQGRVEVYAKAVKGQFRTIKWVGLAIMLAIYYLAPWIRFDRGPNAPDQAILVDMEGRRLYFFWLEIWPQEIYYLTGLLILAAFVLFLVTSLFGRIWCGFACPQTVWTDLFMAVERYIEGDRNERMRFDKQRWTAAKWKKRLTKHAVWLLIAFLTGGAWIMYFSDAPSVVVAFFTGQAGLVVYFFTFLFTATTYLLAGMAREQVCTYMCPWPRIQGALVDQDTLAVTYEAWRGEPRGKHKKGDSWDDRGDCVDCKQCVAVCPTGIDIRDGFQLECIGCGLCIDACNDVMAKVGRPPDLIAYDSERNQERRARGESPVYRLFRPRNLVYVGVLALVTLVMASSFLLRASTELSVIPERNPLFVTLADGSIRNGYDVKIINKDHSGRAYLLSLDDPDLAATLSTPAGESGDQLTLLAAADDVATHRVFVRIPAAALTAASTPITMQLTDTNTGETREVATVFRGPEP